jgi:hypothetical protein
MARHFNRHYTRDEARELLPEIRLWLERLNILREKIATYDRQSESMLRSGDDLGGNRVNEWIANTAEFKSLLREFDVREIQVKDIERGLIDFPTLRGDKEAFLCWELGEDDIGNWHEIDSGFGGREEL